MTCTLKFKLEVDGPGTHRIRATLPTEEQGMTLFLYAITPRGNGLDGLPDSAVLKCGSVRLASFSLERPAAAQQSGEAP